MARAKPDGTRMERVAEGVYRRGDMLIVRVHNPAKGKNGRDNFTVPIADFPTYREALSEAKSLKQREEDKKRARPRNGGEETVRSWAGRWQQVFPRPKESTIRHNNERVRAFVRDFGDLKLRELERMKAELRLWFVGGPALESLEQAAESWEGAVRESDGTVVVPSHRGNLSAVRAMLSDAAKIDLLESNPLVGMKLEVSRGRRDIDVLSEPELGELVELAGRVHGLYGKHVFGPMIEVAAWSGLRPGELFALRPGDVDLEQKIIHVRYAMNGRTGKLETTKNHLRRDVVLLPPAEGAFRRLEVESSPADEPIFRTTHGKPITQRNHFYYWDAVRKAFAASRPAEHWLPRRIEAKGKTGSLDFYELRHFFGTRLARDLGLSPYDIAEMMGHQDGGKLAMERYIHASDVSAVERALQAYRRVA